MTPSEFDKFFSDNLRNNEPAFNPDAWKKAEKMIVDAEKSGYFVVRSKVFPTAFISASLLIIFTLIPISLFKGGDYYSALKNKVKKNKVEIKTAENNIVSQVDSKVNFQQNAVKDNVLIAENTPQEIKTTNAVSRKFASPVITSENKSLNENSNVSVIRKDENLSRIPLLSSAFNKNSISPVHQNKKEENKIRFKPNSLFLLAGTNLSNNMAQKAASSNALASLHLIGIGYNAHIKSNWGFSAALSFNARNPGITARTFETKEYGFGVEAKSTTIKPVNMQYISAPLQINYMCSGGLQFSAGAEIACLINVESEVTKTAAENGEIMKAETSKEWGYTQAFNAFDIGFVSGVSQLLNENLKVGANLYYGLSDITNNDYFKSEKFDRSLQFRLYLQYNFIRF